MEASATPDAARTTAGPATAAADGAGAGDALPPGVDLLWGRRERGRRGPRPGLSLDRIVTAAVEIADQEGLAPLSMSRLAERLGFTTMSLYRYVAGKDELYMLMGDAVMAPGPARPAPGEGWRGVLERWAREALAVYHRHPWVLEIPISGPPVGPNQLVWLDVGLAAFTGTAALPYEKLALMLLVDGYVRGEARLWSDLSRAGHAAAGRAAGTPRDGEQPAGGQPPPSYGHLLRRLIDADRYPTLTEVVATGVLDDAAGYDDSDFSFGLHRVLDGIDAHLRAGAGPPSP